MSYIRIVNNKIENYSIAQLRRDNPNTSFPGNLSDSFLAEYDVYRVSPTEKPKHDAITQKVLAKDPELKNDEYIEVWEVVDLSETEVAANISAFDRKQKKLRYQAYQEESDPLFFKYQRDEITKDEWLSAVDEIKKRYPYYGE